VKEMKITLKGNNVIATENRDGIKEIMISNYKNLNEIHLSVNVDGKTYYGTLKNWVKI